VRSIAFALLAACGGSAATGTKTPNTSGGTEEDWRTFLSTLTGPACTWVGAASFVSCKVNDDTTALIGWEANNRRYVLWLVDANNVRVVPGFAGNGQFTFDSSDGRITLTRQGSGWQFHADPVGGTALDVILAAGPPVLAPPAPTPGADADWRSELQAFVGEWTFKGALAGNPLEYTETCQWLPSATYVFCRMRGSKTFTLIGWEPTNRRFAQYAFDDAGPNVFVGTVSNKNWTFTGKGTITMTRTSPLEYAIKAKEPDGTVVEGTYTTKPGDVE
jgi:hypothetical protein